MLSLIYYKFNITIYAFVEIVISDSDELAAQLHESRMQNIHLKADLARVNDQSVTLRNRIQCLNNEMKERRDYTLQMVQSISPQMSSVSFDSSPSRQDDVICDVQGTSDKSIIELEELWRCLQRDHSQAFEYLKGHFLQKIKQLETEKRRLIVAAEISTSHVDTDAVKSSNDIERGNAKSSRPFPTKTKRHPKMLLLYLAFLHVLVILALHRLMHCHMDKSGGTQSPLLAARP